MSMYHLKLGQLVECEWLDPVAGSEWKDAPEACKFFRFVCRSVGYVQSVEEEGFILCACYGTDPDGDRSLLLRQHLPWGCITELWILREPD